MSEEDLHPLFKECGDWAAELQRQCIQSRERGFRFHKDGVWMQHTFAEMQKVFLKLNAAIDEHAAACVAEIQGPSPRDD